MNYAGAGYVEITGNNPTIPHVTPDFTVTFPGGRDELFSIEALVWDGANDHVVVGPGVGLLRTSLTLKLGAGDDIVAAGRSEQALTIEAGPGNDTIEVGTGATTVSGGPGADCYVIGARGANLTILDASPEDRVRIMWRIASVHADLPPGASHNLLLDVTGPAGRTAHLAIRHFAPGDLGIFALDEASLAAALAATSDELSSPPSAHDLTAIEVAHHP